MKALLSSDIDFIAKKINLSRSKALSLIEEERDMNLVLNEISKTVTKEEAKTLSPNLYHKICVFRFSQKQSFDINEKSYIADAISKHYSHIKRRKSQIVVNGNPTERGSQYLLVATALKKVAAKQILAIENGFR